MTVIPSIAIPVSLIGTFAALNCAGLQHQHHHPVRPGAVDRHRRRRRHHRRRERAAEADARAWRRATRRWQAMHEVTGPDHRHLAGAAGGVRAGGLHSRHHRPALPAVRADHRRRRADLDGQRADAEPGAVRIGAAAARRRGADCSSAASTAASTATSAATPACVRLSGAPGRASCCSSSSVLVGGHRVRLPAAADAPSCRTRTRATSSSTSSCRRRPR